MNFWDVIMTGIVRVDEQLLESQEGQMSLGKPKRRWRLLSEFISDEMCCLAKERDRWRALVSAVMNLSC
jgi:hypothetical protein